MKINGGRVFIVLTNIGGVQHLSQVKAIRQLSRGFQKKVGRKIGQCLAVCRERVQQLI
jgi:hypothetical protein